MGWLHSHTTIKCALVLYEKESHVSDKMGHTREIQLRQPHIEFFRSLEYPSDRNQGKQQKEVSGTIHLDHTGEVQSVTIMFGDEMNTTLPPGDLTFHTHTVLPDKRTNRDMSTDVPSPLDLSSIGLAILHHSTREHLIFTPTYIYAISWFTNSIERMSHKSKQMGYAAFEAWLKKVTENTYNKLVSQYGKNYGSGFVHAWIQAMRTFGYDIRQYPRGANVKLKLGPDRHTNPVKGVGSLMHIEQKARRSNAPVLDERHMMVSALGLLVLGAGLAIYHTRTQSSKA